MAQQYNRCLVLLALFTQVVLGRHANIDISSLDIHNVDCEYGNPSCRCRENADVCHFQFIIQKQMLMTRYRVNEELKQRGVSGTVYYFDNNGTLQTHPDSGDICADIPIGDQRCTPIAELMQPPIVLTLPLMDCFLAPTSLFTKTRHFLFLW